MDRKSRNVTLQDIADELKLSRSAISLAMRNHPSISKETREKVQETAMRMGYRPSPLVSALMTQIRNKRQANAESIALISRLKGPITTETSESPFYYMLYQAIIERAQAKGYHIDEFHLSGEKLSGQRLSKILVSRGIHGVILFPGNDTPDLDFPPLDWEQFATVLIGYNTNNTNLHQIASDYTYDIEYALNHVRRDGNRRIGLAITYRVSNSSNHAWLSRYLLFQNFIPKSERVVPYVQEENGDIIPEKFLAWYRKEKPDVILFSADQIPDYMEEAGIRVPEDVQMVNLVLRDPSTGMAGMNPHTREVGRVSVDLLGNLLQTNQIGVSAYPQSITIKGHWVPGKSYIEKTKQTPAP
ncbi:LacI family DNA-binding transcriptional regulator [Ruficoccus sp. ZRK36]|uniref:LacI family DNA-binding transcriptional regulator n=1 Tax=Ruficoccus sp. ZRK36 TaxID=2866311 RepID=UPI001C73D43B|nr:LacI family DNA-binding transcriptional regulator [Ruficoccus sp. ZRK36]QYY35523.1 LacI family transcriptional regulator [Ruficoccus sp. ZRK36]